MKARLFLIATLALPALFAAVSTRALVGPANEHGPLEPHVAMLLSRQPGGAAFCSAVVLRSNVLLTAAHCASTATDARVFFRDGAGAPVLIEVAAFIRHPEYAPNAIRDRKRSIDLALALTSTALPARFKPATLDQGRVIAVGDRFRVAGYGLSREGIGVSGGVFRWGEIAARAPLSSVLLWSDDPSQNGLGACSGDSGGPIFDRNDDVVVAITDWSTGPDKRTHCGGLTQGALVAPQRAWIDATLDSWRAR